MIRKIYLNLIKHPLAILKAEFHYFTYLAVFCTAEVTAFSCLTIGRNSKFTVFKYDKWENFIKQSSAWKLLKNAVHI
jgi:hypothetical protein